MTQQFSPNSGAFAAPSHAVSSQPTALQAVSQGAEQAVPQVADQATIKVPDRFGTPVETEQCFSPPGDRGVNAIEILCQSQTKGQLAEFVLNEELRLLRERAETCESEAGRQEAFHTLMRHMKGSRPEVRIGVSTASRLRVWEEPLVTYIVSYAALNRTNRFIAVRALLDNIATGSGHLSVNRAKQSIKAIAKNSGLDRLERELQHPSHNVREQAAELLGWLKVPRAIEPLVKAYAVSTGRERLILSAVLERHYAPQIGWYVRARIPDFSHVLLDFQSPA